MYFNSIVGTLADVIKDSFLRDINRNRHWRICH